MKINQLSYRVNHIRKLFPFFSRHAVAYCDNAATTQKPRSVIDAVARFYTEENAPIHRSVYKLAERATENIEQVRTQVAQFIGAQPHEIVFTKGTTESINLVAHSWARYNLKPGDEIVISELEHHSNYLPWHALAQEHGVVLRTIPATINGLDLTHLDTIITFKTRLVAITHCSHVLGTYTDVYAITQCARAVGAKILLDAAQSVAHRKINVQELDIDFLAFSGHKMFAPTGIGILYVRSEFHDSLHPYQLGGGMVSLIPKNDKFFGDPESRSSLPARRSLWRRLGVNFRRKLVSREAAGYRGMPHLLEAGTLPTASIIGLGAAINFIHTHINFDTLKKHEAALCARLIEGFLTIPGITLLGNKNQLMQEGHIVSFIIDGFHPHDVAAYLDTHSICVRAGNHCAQPLYDALGIYGSIRVSFSIYNSFHDVDILIKALQTLKI